ncbi:unnamed protein product [Rotaria sordida]|uniref:Uncharacterized protein n=2 Tax=Rotaria sordida TaxID=392033 RepID=A0A818V8I8_9BILA|nr:unnamed protein product [Rotaria sordida]
MVKYSQLNGILSSTNFQNDWDRFTLIFRHIMEQVKRFTITEEKQHLTIYQINHFKMICQFISIDNFFVVNVRIGEYTGQIKVNINEYYNKQKQKIVKLSKLIDYLSNKINTVLRDGEHFNANHSVQYPKQSNVPQQQISSISSIGSYSPNYDTTQATPPSMQLQQTPFNYHLANRPSMIQAAAAIDQSQNMVMPLAGSIGGPTTLGLSSFHDTEVYPDSRTYGSLASATVDSPSFYPNWLLVQPHLQNQQQQHQPRNQQRGYGNGQNILSQQTSSLDDSNNTSRSTLTSYQWGANYGGAPPLIPQYRSDDAIPTTDTYETSARRILDPPQISSFQMNAAPGVTVDTLQSISSQQTTYMCSNTHELSVYFPQQSEQGLDETEEL